MAAAAAAVAESSLGPRCKKRESRRAAFALLAALCHGEETHLRQTLVLVGGRDLVAKSFLNSADDDSWGIREVAAVDASGDKVGAGGAHGADGEEVGNEGSSDGAAKVKATAVAAVMASPDKAVVPALDANEGDVDGVLSGEPWDYDPTSVLKESGQHVGLQNQVWFYVRAVCTGMLVRVAWAGFIY